MTLETKVKFEDGEFYLINFPVGDWSGDGHEKCDNYIARSRKPLKDVREAHFKAKQVLGFELGSICHEYEDNRLSLEVTNKLKQFGYDFNSFHSRDSNGSPIELNSEEIADTWFFLLNNIDSGLELKRLELQSVLYSYNKEDKRHLSVPGYGVFLVG